MINNLKVNYYETSALNSEGINEAFEGLTKEIMKKKTNEYSEGRTISLSSSKKPKKEKKGCCG